MPAQDRRGGVSTFAAVAMPALIGMGAFAVDLGAVHLRNRQLQGMADAPRWPPRAIPPALRRWRRRASLRRAGRGRSG
jgi:hypothetical protein